VQGAQGTQGTQGHQGSTGLTGNQGSQGAQGSTGGGWPTVNATGAGNLGAQTGPGDTVGYNMTDLGSGGINLLSSGTGSMILDTSAGSGGLVLISAAGIPLVDTSDQQVSMAQLGTGGASVVTGPSSVGGLLLQDEGTGGINVSGVGLIAIAASGSSALELLQTGSGNIVADVSGGTGHVLLKGLPTSDPHVVDALWNNSGVVTISAG
jgi:hypothetical protein